MSILKRTFVYVDGFNLYHAINDLRDDSLKWLCLRRLSESIVRPDERVTKIKYFSAYATWMPAAYKRHRAYVQALQEEGVEFIEGQFKKKFLRCKVCSAQYQTHEEKETDVNIGIHLVRDTFEGRFDRAIIVSADTDMRSAVKMARGISGTKIIDVVSPPKRMKYARSLEPIFELPKGKIRSARLNESYPLNKGRIVYCPIKYRLQNPK